VRIGLDASPLTVVSGGIARYTGKLIDGLSRVDAQNQYVLYGAPRHTHPDTLPPGVALDPIHFPWKPWVDSLHLLGARRRIDLFHGTNYYAPLLTRIPTVLTVHDLTVELMPETHPPARRRWHRVLPILCRRARRIIADSHHTKNDLMRVLRVPEDKIDVIHLAAGRELAPIENERELERVRARYGLPERFMLHLGVLEPRKNVEALIRSLAALRRNGLDERLVLAGPGGDAYVETLKALARELGLEPGRDVVLPGYIQESDLAALYSASRLFVFPSFYEGFGLPPLEAMACGVPVVLAANSSLGELYTENCVMVEDTGIDTLSAAIQRALQDDALRAELAQRGQKLARSRSWDRVAEETLAVYERAL
jgi:glycosyltransferase involved in cell wall biosynthesis